MRSVDFHEEDFPDGLSTTDSALPADAKLNADEVARLQARFVAYTDAGGRGDLVAPDPHWLSERGSAIAAGYKQTYKGGRLFDLRGQLKRLMANRCPSCGGARPGELDHHLPKTAYREFAVLAANLVACCGACNRTKGAGVGATAEEALLHPYFDRLPETPFIQVVVDVGERYVRAALAFDEGAAIGDDLLKARMLNHFARVDVNLQLESEVEELIGETSAGFYNANPLPSAETVATALHSAADAKASYFGQGCWQAAVLRALAQSKAYCAGGYTATRRTVVAGA
jgi:hypothetical protein